ncbi:hypothetical protein [Streptomyces sp. UG1]|uniref:hypothetical protein n=1 Tax=Streptomyces sp. UG1 TaxID=3417652 RepID=UPI003CE8B27E
MAPDDHMIAALKRERAGYVARGDKDRVAQVDEQLRIHGHTEGEAAEGTEPKGRTAAPQQTADADPGPGTGTGTGDGTAKQTTPAKKTAAKKTATTPPAE